MESGLRPGRLEAGKRQVRSERPLFPDKAQPFHRVLNLYCQLAESERRLNPRPEYPRTAGIGEKTNPPDFDRELLEAPDASERLSHFPDTLV